MLQSTFPVTVCVFLVQRQHILLVHRSPILGADGEYTAVTGQLAPGESLEDAVARACREEIGVAIVAPALTPLGLTHRGSGESDGLDAYFVATRWLGEPHPTGACNAVGWYTLDTLPANTIMQIRGAIAQHLLGSPLFDFFAA